FVQAEDGIRYRNVTGVQTCALPISPRTFLTRGMYEEAKKAALRYQNIFGKGNFFLEMQDHGIPEQQTVNQQLMRMHYETGIELRSEERRVGKEGRERGSVD